MEDGTVRWDVEKNGEDGRRVKLFMIEHTMGLIGGSLWIPEGIQKTSGWRRDWGTCIQCKLSIFGRTSIGTGSSAGVQTDYTVVRPIRDQ